MNSTSRFVHWIVWGLLGLVVVSVAGVFFSTLVHSNAKPLPIYGTIPEFALTNQFGQPVSLAKLKEHIVVADIIFTRCPGPCLKMSHKMKQIQDRLPGDGSVILLSLTADPEFDTPPVLKEYASRLKAHPDYWQFLTGPKQVIYDLAMKGFKLAVDENPAGKPEEDRFIHSTRLVLIDREGQLRGVSFEGTENEAVPAVLRAIEQLKIEARR